MANRLKVGANTIAALLAEAGIDIDPKQENGADVMRALIAKIRAQPAVAILVPPEAIGARGPMSTMLPAVGAHLPFSIRVPKDDADWMDSVYREQVAHFQPFKDGSFGMEFTVSGGRVSVRRTSRTEEEPRTEVHAKPGTRTRRRKVRA
jgi:hypothetical protein